MATQLKVMHRKIDAGRYDVFVNEDKVGRVFKEYSAGGSYRWSHSKMPDQDVVAGKNWRTRRGATVSLLIEHFWGKDSDKKKVLKEIYSG